jgi:hypothetical protein
MELMDAVLKAAPQSVGQNSGFKIERHQLAEQKVTESRVF